MSYTVTGRPYASLRYGGGRLPQSESVCRAACPACSPCGGGYAALMAELPKTWSVPVLRADFTDAAAWDGIREKIAEPTAEGFRAYVDFVEDQSLAGLLEAAIVASFPRTYPHDYRHPILFVVDAVAVTTPEHPVLVLTLDAGVDALAFRALPRQVQSIQNNLSLSNMDYIEFAASADADGIFRGF